MAIVLRPITRFKDIDLNFARHPSTNDISILTDARAIARAVKNLVFMNMYDSPFHPEIYSGVRELLFEPMTTSTTVALQKVIEYTVTNFEPRVKLVAVEVKPSYSSNSYYVAVSYNIVGIAELYQVTFSLSRNI